MCPQKLDLCSHHVRCAGLLGPPAFVELALRPTPSPLLLPDPGEGIGTWHVPPPTRFCCSLEFLPGGGSPSWFSPQVPSCLQQLLPHPSPYVTNVELPCALPGRRPDPLASRGPPCRNTRVQRQTAGGRPRAVRVSSSMSLIPARGGCLLGCTGRRKQEEPAQWLLTLVEHPRRACLARQ